MTLAARPASPDDAAILAQIYNEGIEDRVGTFETRPRTAEDVRAWFDGVHPIVVVEADGRVIAFASTSSYRSRECYAGIAEFSVYVARHARGQGAGRVAMRALIDAVKPAGIWKLVSRIFVENDASRSLMASMGFREVGIYEKHAQARRQWRDVVIVERLIPENQSIRLRRAASAGPAMRRTVPQVISLVAIVAGVVLFVVTMLGIDRTETLNEVRRLGVLLPLVLLPSIGWHLLRAAGWYICFPAEERPSYWRVFRVRLAADGVGYFTIRGVASEPLRVVLLMGRVSPVVSAAASVLERTAMGIMSVVGVGIFAAFAVSSDMLPPGWQDVFRGIAITAARGAADLRFSS